MRAPSNEMNNDRADGHCSSFAWIKRSWTFGDPYFCFDGSFSLPIFFVWQFLTQVTHYVTAVKCKKKSIDWKISRERH